MDLPEIKQHVLDALGKILVDKSLIQERDDASLSELVLDEEDYAKLFADLQADWDIVLPRRTVSEISHLSDVKDTKMTLLELIHKIHREMRETKTDVQRDPPYSL